MKIPNKTRTGKPTNLGLKRTKMWGLETDDDVPRIGWESSFGCRGCRFFYVLSKTTRFTTEAISLLKRSIKSRGSCFFSTSFIFRFSSSIFYLYFLIGFVLGERVREIFSSVIWVRRKFPLHEVVVGFALVFLAYVDPVLQYQKTDVAIMMLNLCKTELPNLCLMIFFLSGFTFYN